MEASRLSKLILSVGTQRGKRPLSPVEVGECIASLRQEGLSTEQIQLMLHLENPTMLGRFVTLSKLEPSVQHLVTCGGAKRDGLGFTSASEIARTEAEDHSELAGAVLGYGMTSSEVKQVVQIRRRSSRPLVDCIQEVLQARPVVERRHVLIGGLPPHLQATISGLTQTERDSLLLRAVSTLLNSSEVLSTHLGKSRFTLVATANGALDLQRLSDGFESAISDALQVALRDDN